MSNPVIFQDNRYISAARAVISPFDPGFMYGDGVFETIRLYQGIPFKLNLHRQRLERGLEVLGIPKPEMVDKLPDIINHLSSRNHLQNIQGMVRIMISRGQEATGPTCIIQAVPLDTKAVRQRQQGMKTIVLPWKRDPQNPLLAIKTMNYLENRHGRELAARQGADEGIFLNFNNELCEGTFSNLFLVGKDSIVTPPVEAGLLPGITRKIIIDCCRQEGIVCREEKIPFDRLPSFKGGFLSSSLMELAPLENLGPCQFNPVDIRDAIQTLSLAYQRQFSPVSGPSCS